MIIHIKTDDNTYRTSAEILGNLLQLKIAIIKELLSCKSHFSGLKMCTDNKKVSTTIKNLNNYLSQSKKINGIDNNSNNNFFLIDRYFFPFLC